MAGTDEFFEHIIEEEKRLTKMEQDIESLSKDIRTLQASVSSLVEAWNTANGIVSFVKWVAGLATAVTTIYALIKLVR